MLQSRDFFPVPPLPFSYITPASTNARCPLSDCFSHRLAIRPAEGRSLVISHTESVDKRVYSSHLTAQGPS